MAALMTLSGCGGSSPHRASAANQRASAASVGLLQTADCNLWRVMSGAERKRLLAGLRDFFGGRVAAANTAGQHGSVLSDERAGAVFASYCRLPFAGAFKLYKIYGRAAAFSGR